MEARFPRKKNRIRLSRHSQKCLWSIAINSEQHGGPLPPAGLGQAGGETERAPRLGLCLKGGWKNVFRESKTRFDCLGILRNVYCQLPQIPKSMADHFPPQAFVKRGARPNKPSAWDCVGGLRGVPQCGFVLYLLIEMLAVAVSPHRRGAFSAPCVATSTRCGLGI